MPVTWDKVSLASIVLLRGTEGVLADRALARLMAAAREADPQVEISRIDAKAYTSGELALVTSPSLFGEQRLVIAGGAESMSDPFLSDVLAYLSHPEPDVWLVIRHGGGTRGKKLLDAIAKTWMVVACDPIKRDQDKAAFVREDFSRASRRIEPQAVQALLEAVGSDLRELDAAVRQLLADTEGTVTVAVVGKYHGGRVEATGFKVADAALAGDAAGAVTLARHAIATGTPPVPIVAALAVKLRTLAKVAAARGGRVPAGSLGLAPWQVERAERELRGWRPEALAAAITAVAQADADVKGLSRDPEFALERAILAVAHARSGR